MRALTPEEIAQVIERVRWAVICTVCPDSSPYAVEATPYHDGETMCFMINPRGTTWRNLQKNQHVLVKLTITSPCLSFWAGISCVGIGRFDSDPQAIRDGFAVLGRSLGADYSAAGEKYARTPERSPLLRVTISGRSGRCSIMPGQPMDVRMSVTGGEVIQ
jgi:sugar/nucleoside kinase (ribokinase family)